MLSLIFDTETTGLPSKTLPPDHPAQARVMQLAMVLMDDDKEVGCFYSRFMPDEWPTVHPKAYEAHGLTVGACAQCGIEQRIGLELYNQWVDIADNIVAHNYKFDTQLIDIEAGVLVIERLNHKPTFCTMEILTPVMKLTRANGAPKWPNLAEALDYCYPGTKIEKAHDALGDVRATAKVWRHIVKNNVGFNYNLNLA